MGAVMGGSLVKHQIAWTLTRRNASVLHAYDLLLHDFARVTLAFTVALEWIGAVTICGAMAVNAEVVLGVRTCVAMVSTSLLLFTACVGAYFALSRVAQTLEETFAATM